jgi:hypothetical protein
MDRKGIKKKNEKKKKCVLKKMKHDKLFLKVLIEKIQERRNQHWAWGKLRSWGCLAF